MAFRRSDPVLYIKDIYIETKLWPFSPHLAVLSVPAVAERTTKKSYFNFFFIKVFFGRLGRYNALCRFTNFLSQKKKRDPCEPRVDLLAAVFFSFTTFASSIEEMSVNFQAKTEPLLVRSPALHHHRKQRRAVCTNGRDVIGTVWWATPTRYSSLRDQ